MSVMKTMSGIVAATLMCGGVFAADQPQKINLGTLVPKGSAAYTALQEMGEKWRQASGGSVTLNIHPDGQNDEEATVSLMKSNNLQAALLSVAGLQIIDPSANALQSIPMVFRSLNELDYVREKLRPTLDKNMEQKEFMSLFWGDAGWVRIFATKPVVHPEDLRKLKLFVLTGEVAQYDLMKAAGFRPVQYSYTDTVGGLAQGQIEAVPTIPMYALAGQFDRNAKYMLDINYVPLVGGLVVNAKTWNKISPATREAMRTAAEAAGKKIQTESRREMEAAVATMKTRNGLKVTPMTPALEAEWRQLFEGVYPRIRGNTVNADMFDEVQRLLKEYRK